jgi:hypothetical protein
MKYTRITNLLIYYENLRDFIEKKGKQGNVCQGMTSDVILTLQNDRFMQY